MTPEVGRRRVALAIGDPAGIGCEIVLKALNDPRVRDTGCAFVIVGDGQLIAECNERFGAGLRLRAVHDSSVEVPSGSVAVLHVDGCDRTNFRFGETSAANGRALLAYARAAIVLATSGAVDAVIGAPHNQTSVKMAGVPFDGYGSFVARETGTPESQTFLMALSERFRIAHVTLHLPLRDVVAQVRRDRVLAAIRATDEGLRRMGFAHPRIGVSGLNPHAGENGLFGDEERYEITPAIADARALGIDADGPAGADVMLAHGDRDGYVVMFHDQGHIPVKLERGSAGMTLGLPVLFGSVAHGSAHDIAGRGVADPENLINAIAWSMRPKVAS